MAIQSTGLVAIPHSISSPEFVLAERALHIKRRAVFQHVVTGTAEFVGDGLFGDHHGPLFAPSLIKVLDRRIPDRRVMRGFDKGHRQITIAVSGVAFALGFAVADFIRRHAAGVR